jgi:1-acyl-sn-glycerol-3-phosphate acyltransferase
VILSGSLDRVTFITSVEVRDTPVIGMIARTVGAVFVERRSRAHLFQELNTVTQELLNGGSVVLFPEATSTDGSQILPFKRAFFKSAVEARKPVVPICLNYRFIDGKPLSPENRDYLFYYGNLNIVDQLYKVLKLRSVIVEVQVLDPLDPTEFSRQNMSLPAETQLSERSYQQIASQYVPIV